MTDREIVMSAVEFFKKMAANYESEQTGDGSFADGMSSGSAISLNVAADHLMDILKINEREEVK